MRMVGKTDEMIAEVTTLREALKETRKPSGEIESDRELRTLRKLLSLTVNVLKKIEKRELSRIDPDLLRLLLLLRENLHADWFKCWEKASPDGVVSVENGQHLNRVRQWWVELLTWADSPPPRPPSTESWTPDRVIGALVLVLLISLTLLVL